MVASNDEFSMNLTARHRSEGLFTGVLRRGILRSSSLEVAAWYTKMGLLVDAPNTGCLLPCRIIRTVVLPILPGGPFLCMQGRARLRRRATANICQTYRAFIPWAGGTGLNRASQARASRKSATCKQMPTLRER